MMGTPSVWALVVGLSIQGTQVAPYSSGSFRHGSTSVHWQSRSSVGTTQPYGMMRLRHQHWRLDYRHGFAGRAFYLGQHTGTRQWQMARSAQGNVLVHWADMSSALGLKRIRWSAERQAPTDILWRFDRGEIGWNTMSGYYAHGQVGQGHWTMGQRPDGYVYGAWQQRSMKLRLGGLHRWQESQMHINLGRLSWSFQEMHHVRHGLTMSTALRYQGTHWYGQYHWHHHRRDVHRISLTVPKGAHRFSYYGASHLRDQVFAWTYQGHDYRVMSQLSPDFALVQWSHQPWQITLRWYHRQSWRQGVHLHVQHDWRGQYRPPQAKPEPHLELSPRLWILSSGHTNHQPLPIEMIDTEGQVHRCTVLPASKQLKTHLPPGHYRIRKGTPWPPGWQLTPSRDSVELQSGQSTHWPIHIERVHTQPRWINPSESSESNNQ